MRKHLLLLLLSLVLLGLKVKITIGLCSQPTICPAQVACDLSGACSLFCGGLDAPDGATPGPSDAETA